MSSKTGNSDKMLSYEQRNEACNSSYYKGTISHHPDSARREIDYGLSVTGC